MRSHRDEGSALVDAVIWFLLIFMLLPILVAIARSPTQAARISYAVRAAAEDAAKTRNGAAARKAAAEELDSNLFGSSNPRVCARHDATVDVTRLSPSVADAAPPEPGHVEVTLRCVIDGRLLTGLPLPLQTTVEVRRRQVADVYRRVE